MRCSSETSTKSDRNSTTEKSGTWQECIPCSLTLIPVQALLYALNVLLHLLCCLPHPLGIVHCRLGRVDASIRHILTKFLDDEAHLGGRAAGVRVKLRKKLF